jgi:hypothetical protein
MARLSPPATATRQLSWIHCNAYTPVTRRVSQNNLPRSQRQAFIPERAHAALDVRTSELRDTSELTMPCALGFQECLLSACGLGKASQGKHGVKVGNNIPAYVPKKTR